MNSDLNMNGENSNIISKCKIRTHNLNTNHENFLLY